MDFTYYIKIQTWIFVGVYATVCSVSAGLICCYKRKRERIKESILLAIKRIVTRKKEGETVSYYVCGTECPPHVEQKLIIVATFVIATCASLFALLLIVEIDDECRNDPHLQCFRRKTNLEPLDAFLYERSPANCSAISSAAVVLCFRVDVPDFERISRAGAAAYLAFRVISFCLLLVSRYMLSAVGKNLSGSCPTHSSGCCSARSSDDSSGRCSGYCSSRCIILVSIFISMIICWLLARFLYSGYGYQVEHIPYIRLLQIVSVFYPVLAFVVCVPWQRFKQTSEHCLGEESIPMETVV